MRELALLCALVACACGTDFDHLEYTPIGGVPDGVSLQPRIVSLPVGASVAARIVAVYDNGETMKCEPVLISDDEAIMNIEFATRGSTVFTGVSVGATAIQVHCGNEGGTIGGRVTTAAP